MEVQAHLFNGELGWHNNPVEHLEVKNRIIKTLGEVAIKPGWIAPGGQYQLKDPVEQGWEKVE